MGGASVSQAYEHLRKAKKALINLLASASEEPTPLFFSGAGLEKRWFCDKCDTMIAEDGTFKCKCYKQRREQMRKAKSKWWVWGRWEK